MRRPVLAAARARAVARLGLDLLPALATATAVTVVGFASGGYFPRTWRLSTFALAALVAASLIARGRVRLARGDRAFLLLLGALSVWTGLSARWSGQRTTSLLEAERDLLYVAAAVAVLVALERTAVVQVLVGLVAGVTVVSGYGLGQYLIVGHSLNPIEGNLLFQPLGYANGLGIYAAIGIVVTIGLALASRRTGVRLVALAPLPILAPTLWLTSSRGADLAVAAGLCVLVATSERVARPVAAALIAGAVAAVALVAVVSSGEHGVAARLAGANRPLYWHVAWKEYTLNPVTGSGAGTFDSYWLHYRTVASFARDAHSLYVETLAELGPVGLALLLLALAVPLLALRSRGDPLLAAAGAGYVAFLVHAGVDWDWEQPSVTLAGLACGACVLVRARSPDATETRATTRGVLLALVLVLAGVAVFRLQSGPRLPFA